MKHMAAPSTLELVRPPYLAESPETPAPRQKLSSGLLLPELAVLLLLAIVVTFFVFKDAWVSDDALITFRYVSNFVHGHGPVFNPGDRVQGFTHPLWFLLVTLATAVTGDEIYAATSLSLVLTFITCCVIGAGVLQATHDRLAGLIAAIAVLSILATSESWRSFQTSGLEGALSTMLLSLFLLAVGRPEPKPGALLLLGSLLVLCRPDFALLAGPVCVLALVETIKRRAWLMIVAAALPLLWFVFALAYFGDLLPNTAADKLGIFTLRQAVGQGLLYLVDWISNEPLTSVAGFWLLAVGAVSARRSWDYLLLAGIAAYLCYVLVIGGDFMRGRFFMPILVTACVFGGLAVARRTVLTGRPRNIGVAVASIAVFILGGQMITPRQVQEQTIPSSGIVNERLFYWPGYSLSSYMSEGRLKNAYMDQQLLDGLKAYVDKCGPVTVHLYNPAFAGYYVGPKLTVIDMLGLNDRYIAHLPNEYLLVRPPRVGHPEKKVPIKYMAERGDVSLLPGWRTSIAALDCELPRRVEALREDPGLFDPRERNAR